MLECDWADNNKNKIDKYDFILVDFTRPYKQTCPFILPSLVLSAFFVPDPLDKPWVVPIVTKLRDTFDLSTKGECLEVMPSKVILMWHLLLLTVLTLWKSNNPQCILISFTLILITYWIF